MTNPIIDLFFSDLFSGIENSAVPQETAGRIDAYETQLYNRLTGEEKDLFLRYATEYSNALSETDLRRFIDGFRFGARLMLAIIEDSQPSR